MNDTWNTYEISDVRIVLISKYRYKYKYKYEIPEVRPVGTED